MGFEEVALVEFLKGLAELVLSVHDDRAVPGNGLFQRLPETSRKRMPSSPAWTMFVAAIKEYKRAIIGGRREERYPPKRRVR